jgi:electron transfer flavoprotein beta subunit
VELVDGALRVKRELEGGWFQWVTMPLPAVLTIQSGINQLRYATLKGIMAAKKKDLRVMPAPAAPATTQRIVGVRVPERHKQTRMLTGSATEVASQLVAALRDDARVL